MLRKLPLVVFGVLAVFVFSQNLVRADDMKVWNCKEFGEDFMLSFSNQDGSKGRGLSIHHADQDINVWMSNLKGIIKWDNIEQIEYRPIDEGNGSFYVKLKSPRYLMGARPRSELYFGAVTQECWQKLNQNVKSNISLRVAD